MLSPRLSSSAIHLLRTATIAAIKPLPALLTFSSNPFLCATLRAMPMPSDEARTRDLRRDRAAF